MSTDKGGHFYVVFAGSRLFGSYGFIDATARLGRLRAAQ